MARAKQRKEKGILSPDSYKAEKEEAWQIRREMIPCVRSAKFNCMLAAAALQAGVIRRADIG